MTETRSTRGRIASVLNVALLLAAFLAPWLIRDTINLAMQPNFSSTLQIRVGYGASFIGLVLLLFAWRCRRISHGSLGGFLLLSLFWLALQSFMLAFDAFVVMQ